jgi:hypothetical protein
VDDKQLLFLKNKRLPMGIGEIKKQVSNAVRVDSSAPDNIHVFNTTFYIIIVCFDSNELH